MTAPHETSRSERVFVRLLALFPGEFRERFGQDMRDLFRDQHRTAAQSGQFAAVPRLWLRVLPSLLRAALLERRDEARQSGSHGAPSKLRIASQALEAAASDVRFAGRMLRKTPIFTAVAILVIAFGSGAVTTIFSAMNAIVLRPLPGTTDPDRLIGFQRISRSGGGGTQGSYDFYRHLRDESRTLEGVAAWSKVSLSVSTGGQGTAIYGNLVSGNYFSVLGVRPALGRFFVAEEDQVPLAHPVIVLSHRFWSTRLAGDSSMIGRRVTVNGAEYTLIGVTPPEFRGVFTPLKTDAWVPLMMQSQLRPGRDLANQSWLWLFGRLGRDVERPAAESELSELMNRWLARKTEPEHLAGFDRLRFSEITGLPDDARQSFLAFMAILFGAAVLVLLIASVNVASMLTARAIARQREMALRAALGAGRSRLIRQLLTEVMLLFLVGAIGGLALAELATRAFEGLQVPGEAVIALELSPDIRVLGFAVLVSLLTGLGFGLAPARQAARQDLTARLRNESAGGGRRRSLAGSALIVGQLALSLVLLVSAGLFLRALALGSRVDPGFDREGATTAALNTEGWGYTTDRGKAFYRDLRARLEADPGVTAVSFVASLPLTFAGSGGRITVADGPAPTGPDGVRVSIGVVDAGYFSAIGIPILTGRPIGAEDTRESPRVAVINETMARRFWPDGSAVGRTFTDSQGERITVVGVARDSQYDTLEKTTPSYAYYPMQQLWSPQQILVVRGTGNADGLAGTIQEAVRNIDPVLPRPAVVSLAAASTVALLPQRVAAIVTGVLGAVGLLMATVGLYGVIAYTTGRRTREIGVRMALGADKRSVLGLVVRDGIRLAALGTAIGLVLAVMASRLLRGYLFSLSPTDPVTFTATAALLIVVAAVASYLPARRAARSDPVAALRAD